MIQDFNETRNLTARRHDLSSPGGNFEAWCGFSLICLWEGWLDKQVTSHSPVQLNVDVVGTIDDRTSGEFNHASLLGPSNFRLLAGGESDGFQFEHAALQKVEHFHEKRLWIFQGAANTLGGCCQFIDEGRFLWNLLTSNGISESHLNVTLPGDEKSIQGKWYGISNSRGFTGAIPEELLDHEGLELNPAALKDFACPAGSDVRMLTVPLEYDPVQAKFSPPAMVAKEGMLYLQYECQPCQAPNWATTTDDFSNAIASNRDEPCPLGFLTRFTEVALYLLESPDKPLSPEHQDGLDLPPHGFGFPDQPLSPEYQDGFGNEKEDVFGNGFSEEVDESLSYGFGNSAPKPPPQSKKQKAQEKKAHLLFPPIGKNAFKINAKVTVHGLTSAFGQKLNGRDGVVREWFPESGRFLVYLGDVSKGIKPANLKLTPQKKFFPMPSMFKIGGQVTVHGLTSQQGQKFNGKDGVIEEWVGETGRFLVAINLGPSMGIKPVNLKPRMLKFGPNYGLNKQVRIDLAKDQLRTQWAKSWNANNQERKNIFKKSFQLVWHPDKQKQSYPDDEEIGEIAEHVFKWGMSKRSCYVNQGYVQGYLTLHTVYTCLYV